MSSSSAYPAHLLPNLLPILIRYYLIPGFPPFGIRHRINLERPRRVFDAIGAFDVDQVDKLVRQGVAVFENDVESTYGQAPKASCKASPSRGSSSCVSRPFNLCFSLSESYVPSLFSSKSSRKAL